MRKVSSRPLLSIHSVVSNDSAGRQCRPCQTAQICRLIWAYIVRTGLKTHFSSFRSSLILIYTVCLGTYARIFKVQYNLNGSNTVGLFTMDDSNSFFSPYKILPIAQENKHVGIIFLFYHGIVCCVTCMY